MLERRCASLLSIALCTIALALSDCQRSTSSTASATGVAPSAYAADTDGTPLPGSPALQAQTAAIRTQLQEQLAAQRKSIVLLADEAKQQ